MGIAASGIAGFALSRRSWAEQVPASDTAPAVSSVAVTTGESRAANVLGALKRIEPEIKNLLGRKKRILIKPNLVNTESQLCATHADCLHGILEFFAPLTTEPILIAETSANGPTFDGYSNYGHLALESLYPVRFMDLDDAPFQRRYVINERHHAVPIRFSSLLNDPEVIVISTAPFKTHDRAVVTLGIKNLAVGGILKDKGFRWGAGSVGISDKHLVHGGPENQGIHYNLFALTQIARADLTVLDGFQGMEHNGPISGTPVEHRVAVAGVDPVAVDATAARLMGFEPTKIGYMVFCDQAGLGTLDASRISILGPELSDLSRPYRPHDSIEKQYGWI